MSENEDLQIKAAMVNLKKLKLDIEMKQVSPFDAANSKRGDSITHMQSLLPQQTLTQDFN